MNEQEFNAWFDTFHKENRGVRPPKQWFRLFEERHAKLREKLGGISKVASIEVDNIENPVDYEEIKNLVAKLIALVPEYFNQEKVPVAPKDLVVPFIRTDKGEMRWGKSVQQFVKRLKNKDIDEKEVNNVLSKLGEHWAKCKVAKQPIVIEVTTDPRAFALLGHYPTDQNKSGSWSCFKQGAGHQIHKYMLGMQPHSYIILGGFKSGLVDSTKEVKMRGWGIANPKLDVFNVCNVYFGQKIQEALYLKAVDEAFAEVLGVKKPYKIANHITVTGVFQNKHVNLSFANAAEDFAYQEYALRMSDGLEAIRYCVNCRDSCDPPVVVDGREYCQTCVDQYSKKCDFSGDRTFQGLSSVRGRNNESWRVMTKFIHDRTFVSCALTGAFYHKDDMLMWYDGRLVSKFEVAIHDCKQCNECKRYANTMQKHPEKDDAELCPCCWKAIELKKLVASHKTQTGKVPLPSWEKELKYGYYYEPTSGIW